MNRIDRRRGGFSLVELSVAMAMMAALTTGSIVLLRTCQTAWNRHQADMTRRQDAAAVLRHMVRRIRQAVAVTSITDATDNSGALSVLRSDGITLVWDHDGVGNDVLYGETTATSVLAENITGMSFLGLKADGTSATTQTDRIHSVRCTLSFTVDRPAGPATEQVAAQAWLRSW